MYTQFAVGIYDGGRNLCGRVESLRFSFKTGAVNNIPAKFYSSLFTSFLFIYDYCFCKKKKKQLDFGEFLLIFQ